MLTQPDCSAHFAWQTHRLARKKLLAQLSIQPRHMADPVVCQGVTCRRSRGFQLDCMVRYGSITAACLSRYGTVR